jgi:hypothetical protein
MKTLSIVLAVLTMALTPLAEAGVKNIVIVHGAFADGSGWRPVATILEHDGYTVYVVQEPLTSWDADLAATAESFGAKVTVAAWSKKTSFAVIPSRDRQINPDLERFMATRAESETLEFPGSHVIFLLHPKEVAALIEKAAQTAK